MSKVIEFERSWCDYLTSCPYFEDTEVGSFDCANCEFYDGCEEDHSQFNVELCDYSKYFKRIKGIVKCKHI